jgi:hypothetical protein
MHMGWHDEPQNGPGVLTALLAYDVSKINGVTTE